MPDQPGKGPPSSAPLSLEDADRLAESFTPFWEDDVAPARAPVSARDAGAAKPVFKDKLRGIAPINIGPATQSAPPAAPPTYPQPVVPPAANSQPTPAAPVLSAAPAVATAEAM